ncbi:MAG: hypothetical protein ACK4UT_00955 [Moraxellaceae bacterium]
MNNATAAPIHAVRAYIDKCRAVLAGTEVTPEQMMLSHWWAALKKHQQRAVMTLAGIPDHFTLRPWLDMPRQQRAAIVLAIGALAPGLLGIQRDLVRLRHAAAAELQRARESGADLTTAAVERPVA